MLDERKREVVLAFAECSMSLSATAKKLHFHRNTIEYHLKQTRKKTGLDPCNFYDLIKLLEIAERMEEEK
jgi:sugar diacid utilization regulator